MIQRLVSTMTGEPEAVLTLAELPDDAPPGPGEVTIEVMAVGLNFLDVALCRGSYPVVPEPPRTPGVEACGRVVAAGPGAEGLLGSQVLACPTFPRGALGTHVTVAASLVVQIPGWLDPVVGAALPVTYQTAWFALERARVREGDLVVVLAGAGGVGIATIQLALARNAVVVAAASTADKRALCLAEGAAVAVDYAGLPDVVSDLTRSGAEVVIDPVGGPQLAPALRLLRPEGRLVAVGSAGGAAPPVAPEALMAANVDLIGLSWGSTYPWTHSQQVGRVYRALFAGLRDGTVRPRVERVVALTDVPAALGDLAARRSTGKIVATPQEEP